MFGFCRVSRDMSALGKQVPQSGTRTGHVALASFCVLGLRAGRVRCDAAPVFKHHTELVAPVAIAALTAFFQERDRGCGVFDSPKSAKRMLYANVRTRTRRVLPTFRI